MPKTIFQSCTSKTSSKTTVNGLPYTLSRAATASNSIPVCPPASSAPLLSAASSSFRASSAVNSGFSYRSEPNSITSASVDVPACTLSFWCCLRSRRTRKYSTIPASDTPTVTPTPKPALLLELSPEVAVLWSVGSLSEDVEGNAIGFVEDAGGSAIDFVSEAMVEVDGEVVFLVGDTEVETEKAFVD